MRQIVLLRGINLGSSRRVSMAELRDLLAGLGYVDVRTHLQSGNVVLTSRAAPARLQAALETQIAAGLGLDVQVLVRTRDELADVVARNPLGDVADNPSRYVVSFLWDELDPERGSELEAVDLAPEQCVISGREIYTWHPGGIHASPLAKLLAERRLGAPATARNWNTVMKLLELADA